LRIFTLQKQMMAKKLMVYDISFNSLENVIQGISDYLTRYQLWTQLKMPAKIEKKMTKSIVKSAFEAVFTPQTCLALKMQCRLSKQKYRLVRQTLEKEYDHVNRKFLPKEIMIGNVKINVPKTLAFFSKVNLIFFFSLKVKEEQDKLKSKLSPIQTACGSFYNPTEYLLRLLENDQYKRTMDLASGKIQLKLAADGFRQTRMLGATNFYFTLLNFGKLIHSPFYNFTVATLEVPEDDIELMRLNLAPMLANLKLLQETGIDVDGK
jgi:hypothetical protein